VKDFSKIKVAIVCDWLTTPGGAEKVVEVLANIFPKAPIYTSVCDKKKFPWLKNRQLITSWLDSVPFLKYKHQLWAPWRPLIFEEFDFSGYDLVISSTSAEAKDIITKPGTIHVCYCHTPIRYFWSDYHKYLGERLEFGWLNPIIRLVMPLMTYNLRITDRLGAERVDYFIANSLYVKNRIAKYYRRQAKVIYPPVEKFDKKDNKTQKFGNKLGGKKIYKDFYLCFGRLVPYKRADLAVAAFLQSGKRLIVAGDGPHMSMLKKMVGGAKNIELLEGVDDNKKKILLQNCRALVFPGEEDFGIVPVEAMMYGKPVVAYGRGGARETVIEGKSGVLFYEQDTKSLNEAIDRLEGKVWNEKKIMQWAENFDQDRFVAAIKDYINTCLENNK